MDKHLILVRHSTPEINHAIPSNQWNLNETGTKRAKLLARQLSSFPVDVVVSSPETKALETARIIASYHSLDLTVHNGLHEHDRTQAPFLSESDFKEAIFYLFKNPDELTYGSETATDAERRFENTVKELLVDHPNGDTLIVSHGTVMALFIAKLVNKNPFYIWREMSMPIAYVFSRPKYKLRQIIRLDRDEK